MASRQTVVDYTYDDPRTGDRVRERRIQEIPFNQIDKIEQRELALVRVPSNASQELDRPRRSHANDDDYYANHRRSYEVDQTKTRRTRERADDNGHLPPYNRSRQDLALYHPRSSRRRDDYYYDDSDRDSSRERHRSRRHRRTRSDRGGRSRKDDDGNLPLNNAENQKERDNNDDDDLMWYSMKKRRDGNIVERNFDSSYDGLIAAGAGAAIGFITARRFAGEENQKWKTLGGAVVGAAAFNVAENRYRMYTEEKQERREEREEQAVEANGPVRLP